MSIAKDKARPGGGFLTAPVPKGGIFTREQFGEEAKLFSETASKFWREEVLKQVDAIEHKAMVEEDGKKVPLAIKLLRKTAEMGLLAVDLPEDYGGLGMDKSTSFLLAEALPGCNSVAATIGAHSGIGTLPIVYFGTKEQKQLYLPKLATAELVACYALTEPGAGSDALSGRTTATPVEDGKAFLINGEKQYITNGAWADIAIVFAGIEGQYSAFIVDLHSKGVKRGNEEKKMGIRGSSTTSLVFEDVRVPRENMLGKPGDAANIALNILYVGRLKLGYSTLGTAKYATDLTIQFGRDRKQFGQPVISFEMQKAKLADMVCSTFALDSLCYRVAGAVDAQCAKVDKADEKYDEKIIRILRSFGLETSIIKIAGSETLMRVANHAVRMHGGYGFCEDYHVERVMRDNVVDTIFEGTNDINRMVMFGNLVQSALGAEIDFREATEALHADLRAGNYKVPVESGPLGPATEMVSQAKRALLYTVEQAIIGVGKDVRVEQQVMASMSDALIALYGAESALARTYCLWDAANDERKSLLTDICTAVAHDRGQDIRRLCLDTLAHVVPPGELEKKRTVLLNLVQPLDAPVDIMRLRRTIADHAIEAGRYDL